jgi:hypothetical protein
MGSRQMETLRQRRRADRMFWRIAAAQQQKSQACSADGAASLTFLADRVGFEPTSRLRDYLISSAAPSTTRTTLRIYFHPCFLPKNCSKIRWGENRRDGKKYSILRFSVLRNIKEMRGDEIPSFCRNFESFMRL